MPVYEYACTACGERTEAKQSFDDPPLTECPRCGGRLRKLYSPVGIVFRGSGFYSTDSSKAKKAASNAKDAKDSKDSNAKESSSKDSKAGSKPAAPTSSSSGEGKSD